MGIFNKGAQQGSGSCPHPISARRRGGYVWRKDGSGKHAKDVRYQRVDCGQCGANWEEPA